MARKRSPVKRIDDHCSSQITYSKRREGILKKASELSVLCDTDVGLLMFSPTGRLTTFGHRGRFDDILLRYIDRPHKIKGTVDNEKFLYESLKHLKCEGQMLEKLASLEALELKLLELNQKKYNAQEKMRCYNPGLNMTHSSSEARFRQEFVANAIARIEKLKNAKLHGKEMSTLDPNNIEIAKVSDLTTEESLHPKNSYLNRKQSADHPKEETPLARPHISFSCLQTQKHWGTQTAGDIASSEKLKC